MQDLIIGKDTVAQQKTFTSLVAGWTQILPFADRRIGFIISSPITNANVISNAVTPTGTEGILLPINTQPFKATIKDYGAFIRGPISIRNLVANESVVVIDILYNGEIK